MSLLKVLVLFTSVVSAGITSQLAAASENGFSSNLAVEAPGYVDDDLLSRLQMYSQFAAAAYCRENNVAQPTTLYCRTGNCPIVQNAQVRTVMGFSKTRMTDANGYLAVDNANQQIVLAFRGSESLKNWLTDFSFLYAPTDLCPMCALHSGFWGSWKEARKVVLAEVKSTIAQYPNYKIIVTGHSLGGALATVAAGELRKSGYVVDMYTYGAPKVAPAAGTKYLTTRVNMGGNYRVTNLDDPVPRLPPSLVGFVQLFPEYHIDNDVANNPVAVNDMLVYDKPNVPRGLNNKLLDVKAHVHYFGNITVCAYTEKSAGLSSPLRIPKLEGLLDDGVKEVANVLRGAVGGVTNTVGGVVGVGGNVVGGLGKGVNGLGGNVVHGLGGTVSGLGTGLSKGLGGTVDGLGTGVVKGLGGTVSGLGGVVGGLGKGVGALSSKLGHKQKANLENGNTQKVGGFFGKKKNKNNLGGEEDQAENGYNGGNAGGNFNDNNGGMNNGNGYNQDQSNGYNQNQNNGYNQNQNSGFDQNQNQNSGYSQNNGGFNQNQNNNGYNQNNGGFNQNQNQNQNGYNQNNGGFNQNQNNGYNQNQNNGGFNQGNNGYSQNQGNNGGFNQNQGNNGYSPNNNAGPPQNGNGGFKGLMGGLGKKLGKGW